MADNDKDDNLPVGQGDTQRSQLFQNKLTEPALPPAMTHRESHSSQTKADK